MIASSIEGSELRWLGFNENVDDAASIDYNVFGNRSTLLSSSQFCLCQNFTISVVGRYVSRPLPRREYSLIFQFLDDIQNRIEKIYGSSR